MTNLEYSHHINDITLMARVVLKYIYKFITPDAPLWEKEKLYDEWCSLECDKRAWYDGG